MDIYIDCEWFIPQNLFLVGWCNNTRSYGQLYGYSLNKKQLLSLLNGCKHIFFYGPDIGVLENFFNVDIRNNFFCVNLLKCFRDHVVSSSYKLANLEIKFGIYRDVDKYKRNMRLLYKDWFHPVRRNHVLLYNLNDVINLYVLTQIIFKNYGITEKYLKSIRLK